MQIELWRGPLDGELREIPDETKIWIATVSNVDMRRLLATPDADIPLANEPGGTTDHCYAITMRLGVASGMRIFEYVGERVKK
jgi:hypothetical protein